MVKAENDLLVGPEIVRKNGCIINTGANPTPEQTRKKLMDNEAKYAIPAEVYESISLPNGRSGTGDAPFLWSNELVDLKKQRAILQAEVDRRAFAHEVSIE
jgi:hypothetical protein